MRNRAYRRMQKRVREEKHIIEFSIYPHRFFSGYVKEDDRTGGKYISRNGYTEKAKCLKKVSRKKVRRTNDELPRKGNKYKRLFDYEWNLD